LNASAPCWPSTAWSSSSSAGKRRRSWAPPELKFRLDAQALALGQNYTFEVDGEYRLDLLGHLEADRDVRGLDRESLLQLEAIKRLREQEGLR